MQILSELKLAKGGPVLGALMTKAKEWQYAHALTHASAPDGPPAELIDFLMQELGRAGKN